MEGGAMADGRYLASCNTAMLIAWCNLGCSSCTWPIYRYSVFLRLFITSLLVSRLSRRLSTHCCPRTLYFTHFEAMSSQQGYSMASANCPPTPCRYVASDNTPCSTYITCTTAAGHFRSAHGVELSSPDATLQCGWQGCGNTIERRNLVRHIQGAHLQHGRGGAHA
ncbi:hypothetical protein M404DRAFT_431960 [Pisolithus tinctorius Marx 270]|uniref:Uncharacterized protein n=1 Tax=Pisolithus tinctorius Marx 270 TaxID=870435 RepID=A0A0C3PGX8_PISTI|nr:hypothetical protein M404DRAFT_431960 [Pisolithus tinctorius Marx 270]